MKNSIDWFFLRRPLLFLLVAVVLSATLIILGMQFEEASHEAYRQGEASLNATHRKYENMVNDIDLLEQYTVHYSDYKASGLIGGERRLSWIESLESTNSVLRLPHLSYNLLAREDFQRAGLKVGKNVVVNSSPMELNMDLLHEEDLFALVEGLGYSISSLFTVDGCNIILTSAVGESFTTKKANMKATCIIRWINIDVK